MADSVGTIFYEVDANTRPLVDAEQQAMAAVDRLIAALDRNTSALDKNESQMTKTAAGVRKANRDVNSASKEWSALGKVILAVASIRTLQWLSGLSDAYGQYASRVRNATSSTEEYEMVQARLLETANGTYRSLNEAQEVYLSVADVLRDLGYTTADVLDVTDSLSYAFVRDAARADQAQTAMDAYSKALQKGRIDADAWSSVLAAAPSIVNAISEATGRSAQEIRNLGANGRLSIEALNEGLRRSRDENKAFADEMETSTRDAVVQFTNSLQVFVGKVNESAGASKVFTENVGALSAILQDPATIEAATDLASGIVLALNTIIKAMRETVAIVKWGAEELAARFGGIAADDIVRLEQRAEKLSESLAGMMDAGHTNKPIFERQRKELDELNAKIEAYYRLQEDLRKAGQGGVAPPVAPPPASGAPTGLVNAEAPARTTGKAAKKTDAQKAKEKALKDAARAATENAQALQKLQAELTGVSLASRDLAQFQAQLTLNEYATPEQIEMVRQIAGELWDATEGAKMLASVDPAAAQAQSYEEQLQKLQTLREAELLTEQRYNELKLQAAKDHDAQMAVIQEEAFRRQSVLHETLMNSVDALGAGVTQAFAGVLSGTFNAQEALRAFGMTVLQAGVGALVELGVQAVKTAIIQRSTAATAAAGYVTSVAGQVAATTALAAQAAFASTAAIPIVGPVLAPAAAAAAGASAASLGAPAVAAASTTVAGARQYGGAVASGKMYRINEGGKPEIMNAANGQQYLLPNTRGEVVSNKDASGSASSPVAVYVNVHQAPERAGAVEQRRDEDAQVIDIFVADIMGNGKAAQTLQGVYGVRRQGK